MEQLMLDLIPTGAKAVCHVSQNDIGRTIRFNLTSGGTAYTLAGTETIKVYIKKPDGTTAERNIANTSSTYVDWVTGEGDCDVAGKNECELVITSGTTVIGSKNFTMKVEEDPYNGQGVVIETAGPAPVATFDTNIVDLFVEIKCSINAIQEGTPWIDSNVIEKEPYNFRKVAGTASRIGNHLFDKLVGGTVAWNQLITNGNFTDTSGWESNNTEYGTISVSNNALEMSIVKIPPNSYTPFVRHPSFTMLADRKYFVGFDFSSPYLTSVRVETQGGLGVSIPLSKTGSFERLGTIYTRPSDSINSVINVYPQYLTGNWSVGDKWYIKNVVCIDLTAMFGSTIADYIYSLEQATAGSGVNFFRKLFPKDYYAFNAGELMSVKTTAHVMRGFNACDEIFESGNIDTSTGENLNDNTKIRTKNFLPVIPNTAFYFSTQTSGQDYYINPVFYDKNKNYVGYLRYGSYSPKSTNSANFQNPFTIPENAYYMRFVLSPAYGTTYKNDICINISDTNRNGEYEPYTEHNYALDDVDLRGFFKLDSNNKLYADGDTYESIGDVTRKYVIVDLGSLNWGAGFGGFYSASLVSTIKLVDSSEMPNMLCEAYKPINYANKADKTISIVWGGADNPYNSYINVLDSGYNDAAAFKTAMSGKYLLYERATPTTETADPFTNPQEVDEYGTEEYVDNRPVAIPVGHETYYADIYDISGFTACKVSVKDGSNVEQKSATISFGQTVYGGYLEHKNGQWTFTGDRAYAKIKNIGMTRAQTDTDGIWRFVSNDALAKPTPNTEINEKTSCEVLPTVNNDSTYLRQTGVAVGRTGNIYFFTQDGFDNVTAFKARYGEFAVVYELPTPFTLTLTGAQLETLLGENRVSHNCNGDTEVKYLYNA